MEALEDLEAQIWLSLLQKPVSKEWIARKMVRAGSYLGDPCRLIF